MLKTVLHREYFTYLLKSEYSVTTLAKEESYDYTVRIVGLLFYDIRCY